MLQKMRKNFKQCAKISRQTSTTKVLCIWDRLRGITTIKKQKKMKMMILMMTQTAQIALVAQIAKNLTMGKSQKL